MNLGATSSETSVAWTQVGGTPVTWVGAGQGLTRAFIVPATRAGDILTFRATATNEAGSVSDDMTQLILPHSEWAPMGGAEVPVKSVAVKAPV